MKITKMLGVLTISLIALSSCKKDYDCMCEAGGIGVDAETYENVTKVDAEEKCDDYEEEVKEDISNDITCSVNEAN